MSELLPFEEALVAIENMQSIQVSEEDVELKMP